MKKYYQILYRGIYTNELAIHETTSMKEFMNALDDFKKGKYKNLILIDTNIAIK